jgi:hypothetical protein
MSTNCEGPHYLKVGFEVLTAASMKMAVFGLLHRRVWQKFTNISEVLEASIIRVMTHHPDTFLCNAEVCQQPADPVRGALHKGYSGHPSWLLPL